MYSSILLLLFRVGAAPMWRQVSRSAGYCSSAVLRSTNCMEWTKLGCTGIEACISIKEALIKTSVPDCLDFEVSDRTFCSDTNPKPTAPSFDMIETPQSLVQMPRNLDFNYNAQYSIDFIEPDLNNEAWDGSDSKAKESQPFKSFARKPCTGPRCDSLQLSWMDGEEPELNNENWD